MLFAVLWCMYICALVIGTEVFAYIWHKYGAHDDYIPGIHDTHRIHHMLGDTHEADEDFVWILLLMCMFELTLGVGVMLRIIPGILALVTIITSLCVFWWNWWMHRAYHQPQHWLNNYEWFQLEKARHFVHHDNPEVNYGIASHFTDRVFGTYNESISENIIPM